VSRRGIVVALGGVDSAGKSTQRDLLLQALRDQGWTPVSIWARLGYSPGLKALKRAAAVVTGRRKHARGEEKAEAPGRYPRRAETLRGGFRRRLWLTAALLDLLWVYGILVPLLRALGRAVVCDRYLLDCLVDLRVNFPDDRPFLCRLLRRVAARPDAAFCLIVPPDVSAQRARGAGKFNWESREHLEKRRQAYADLCGTLEVTVLDGERPVDEIAGSIRAGIAHLHPGAAAAAPVPEGTAAGGAKARGKHHMKGFLRGSSLLLAGRLISIGINFLVQVLAVRYLAKADYGAFAWALAIVSMGSATALLGLNRGLARYVPIYHEHKQYKAMFGTMVMALATVAGLGLAIAAVAIGAHGLIAEQVGDPMSAGLLMIMICLVPLEAVDGLMETLLAAFAGARSIFVRRYLVAPGLKLAAVVLVMSIEGSVYLLGWAYLLAGAIGIVLYVALLWRALVQEDLTGELRRGKLEFPARALFGFSLPLLTTDLLLAVETPMVIVILDHYHGNLPVADLRAVEPVAGLCLIVFQTLKILFRPHAARLYARKDDSGLGSLYWQSASWVTVASFPIFAASIFLADPLTLLLFGERYRGAGVLLAILAAGRFFSAALGVNTFMLQVYGRVKLILFINGASAALGVGLCFWLIPLHGAVGAAIASSGTIILRNVFYQSGLVATAHIGRFPRRAVKVYASVAAAVTVLGVLAWVSAGVVVMTAAVAVTSLALAWLNRRYLQIGDTFPELAKVPLLGRVLGAKRQTT
jgi:O-antigen/teichoic acid export membrane protein/thymidylate kinase